MVTEGDRWKGVYRDPAAADRYAGKRAATRTSRRREAREAAIVTALLDGASLRGPGRALDCPAGTGRFVPLLEARGYATTAADIAAPMLAHAPASRRVVADVERLPFPDRTFDLVLCIRLLHHIPTDEGRRRLLRELARVARGPVVLSFFHALSLSELRNRLQQLVRPFEESRHAITTATLRADAETSGLRVITTTPVLRFLNRQWFARLERL